MLKQIYQQSYQREMVQAIEFDVTGELSRVLLGFLSGTYLNIIIIFFKVNVTNEGNTLISMETLNFYIARMKMK